MTATEADLEAVVIEAYERLFARIVRGAWKSAQRGSSEATEFMDSVAPAWRRWSRSGQKVDNNMFSPYVGKVTVADVKEGNEYQQGPDRSKRIPPGPPKYVKEVPAAILDLEQQLAAVRQTRVDLRAELETGKEEYAALALRADAYRDTEAIVAITPLRRRRSEIVQILRECDENEEDLVRRLEAVRVEYRKIEHGQDLVDFETAVKEVEPLIEEFRQAVVSLVELGHEIQRMSARIDSLYARCYEYATFSHGQLPSKDAKMAVRLPHIGDMNKWMGDLNHGLNHVTKAMGFPAIETND